MSDIAPITGFTLDQLRQELKRWVLGVPVGDRENIRCAAYPIIEKYAFSVMYYVDKQIRKLPLCLEVSYASFEMIVRQFGVMYNLQDNFQDNFPVQVFFETALYDVLRETKHNIKNTDRYRFLDLE